MATTNSFGAALRGWRERLSPADGGLDADGRRRIPGLRREELARLAGLSVDYVVRLEQGRARNPSAQVVTALARALRLDPAEREHLFRCANLALPSGGSVPMHVPERVHRMVGRMSATPVAVFSADWTVLGCNAMWCAAIGDPRTYGWQHGSLVAGMFRARGEQGRRTRPIAAWPVHSRRGDDAEEEALVADLRATAVAYPADARLAAFIAHMLGTSPRFARLWMSGGVRAFVGDPKTVEHPEVGDIALDLDVLTVPGADLRIVTYDAAVGTEDAEKLDVLRAACRPPGNGRRPVGAEPSGVPAR